MVVVVGELQTRDVGRHEGPVCAQGFEMQDKARHHVPFGAPVESATVFGVKGEAEHVSSERVHSRNATDIRVVNRLRFHKRWLCRYHDFQRLPEQVFLPAQGQIRTNRGAASIPDHARVTLSFADGYQIVARAQP